jgi:diphthine-ammonia ligase
MTRKETKTIVHSDHAFATVAYLEVKDASLEDKPDQALLQPTIPPLLDDLALRVQEACSELQEQLPLPDATPTYPTVAAKPSIRVVGSWAYISDVQCDRSSTGSVEEEVIACFETIKGTQAIASVSHAGSQSYFLIRRAPIPTRHAS